VSADDVTRDRSGLRATRRARRVRPDRRVSGRVLGGIETGPLPGQRRRSMVARSPRWSPQPDQLSLVASLVEAGVPLDDAFETLAVMGGTARTREATAAVRDALRAGLPLSRALDEVGVPDHVGALVRGGERVGQVASALRASSDLVRRIVTLKGDLQRALIYPGVVLALGLGILVIVAVVVVPSLERTFTELGGELPAATRAVLVLSTPLRDPMTLVLLPGALVLSTVMRRWRWPRWQGLGQRVRSLPLARQFDTSVRLSVVTRLVATMLGGGLPLVDALRTAENTLPAGALRSRLRAAIVAVESGGTALGEDALGGLFDPAERELIAVGERTGMLAAQWERVADRRANELSVRIARVGAIVEPVLVVAVGALVGGCVLALYLPTFRVLDLL
jgi:type II secretory pathway component PulF